MLCKRSEYISVGALEFLNTNIVNSTSVPGEKKEHHPEQAHRSPYHSEKLGVDLESRCFQKQTLPISISFILSLTLTFSFSDYLLLSSTISPSARWLFFCGAQNFNSLLHFLNDFPDLPTCLYSSSRFNLDVPCHFISPSNIYYI